MELSHAERAEELLAQLGSANADSLLLAQMAQVHATLALVDAVESWRPPVEEDQPIPPGQTKDTWKWDNDGE